MATPAYKEGDLCEIVAIKKSSAWYPDRKKLIGNYVTLNGYIIQRGPWVSSWGTFHEPINGTFIEAGEKLMLHFFQLRKVRNGRR